LPYREFLRALNLTLYNLVHQRCRKAKGLMAETDESAIIGMLRDPVQRNRGFVKLMDLYKEQVYWHIRRLAVSHEDAEDILQETFIKVYRHAGSFRGDSKIFTWLYRIATNECSRHFMKSRNRLRRSSSVNGEVIGDLSGTDLESSSAILLKFQRAIQKLPKKQKIVFNLRYYDELNYEDIAEIMGSTVNSSKTNYHLASEKIKKYLIDHA
jgi:RNA polymerase sigma-70 factor, ECF subfamily